MKTLRPSLIAVAAVACAVPAVAADIPRGMSHLGVAVVVGASPETLDSVSQGGHEMSREEAMGFLQGARDSGARVDARTLPFLPDGGPVGYSDTRSYLAEVLGPEGKTKTGSVTTGAVVSVRERSGTLAYDFKVSRLVGHYDGFDRFSSQGYTLQLPNVEEASGEAKVDDPADAVVVRKGDLLVVFTNDVD